MNQRVKTLVAYCHDAGSILDVAATSRCVRLVPRESFNERLRADFDRVGGAIRHGMNGLKEETSPDGTRPSSRASG